MSRKTLALVTIGQAPRVDVTPEIAPLLSGVQLLETGALDLLSEPEILELYPRPGEKMLVSRLRDGSQAMISETRVHAHLQGAVDRAVAQGANVVLIMCTGHLEGIVAPIPLYMAEVLARGAVQALVGEQPLGVISPEPEQMSSSSRHWAARLGREVQITSCSPYTASLDDFAEAGAHLRGVAWVVLDCIGYSEEMADRVRAATDAKVLTARSVAVRLVSAAL